jgi:4-aminobutyrate--pyruvate transaminase
MINETIYRALVAESEKIGVFGHGFTYGGHPVPAAVALETLRIYEEGDLVGDVRRVTPRFQDGLRRAGKHPLVGEAHGVGLLGGLELVRNKATKESFLPTDGVAVQVGKRAQAHGVIVRALGDTVSLCRPLIITEIEIDDLLTRIERTLDDTYDWVQERGLIAA